MKHLLFALALLSFCPPEQPPQAAKPDRKWTADDRTRFLAAAMFEGLHEDYPDPKIFEKILKDRDQHFVPKCPICNPVAGGIEGYIAFSKSCVFPYEGKGFPAELRTGLISKDRDERLKAIAFMVERYVKRRFEQWPMTPGEKQAMSIALLMGRKFGASAKEPTFGDYCPSCNGATNN